MNRIWVIIALVLLGATITLAIETIYLDGVIGQQRMVLQELYYRGCDTDK